MRTIVINSNVNAESAALLCAHLQNVQTHSVIITDSSSFLRCGDDIELNPEGSEPVTSTVEVYMKKFKDVLIAYVPGLASSGIDDAMIASLVDAAIDYISKVTLEQVENAVVYLGSTLLSEDVIRAFVTKTESLYVRLVNYKSTEKLDTTFNWAEGKIEEDKNLDAFQYTVLYDKKYMKQATKLGRKVLLLTEKDVLAVLEATRQEKFTSSGLVKNIIVTICATQLHVPEKSVESWLSQQH